MRRFYCDKGNIKENTVYFDRDESKHISKVLRLEAGEEIIVSAGDGIDRYCTLTFSGEELMIQELFCHFVNKIAIKERENLALQQQMLPLRFRSNMIEV